MNTDVWETLRGYTELLENTTIKNSTSKFLNQKWSQLLRDLLKTVQCHLANTRL